MKAYHPAMNSGCTITPLAAAPVSPRKISETDPNSSDPLNSSDGIGRSSFGSPPALSAKPTKNRVDATTVPATGPAMATSKMSSRVFGSDLICVMLPNVPSWPLGMRNGMPIFTPRTLAAIMWPTSCAAVVAQMPPAIGKALSTYCWTSKSSRPGGSSPGARVVSMPCDPAASQSIVAWGSRETSATRPS